MKRLVLSLALAGALFGASFGAGHTKSDVPVPDNEMIDFGDDSTPVVEVAKTDNGKVKLMVANYCDDTGDASIMGHNVAKFKISETLARKIESALVDSEKFVMLENKLETGETLAGDEIVLAVATRELSIAAPRATSTSSKARANSQVEYRLVKGGAVKYTRELNLNILIDGSDDESYLSAYLDVVAEKIATDATTALYPLRIASVDGKSVELEGEFVAGSVYDVFDGKKKAGQIKVGEDAISGEIIKGVANAGDICKLARAAGENKSGGNVWQNIRTTESGGVILPFDKQF